MGLARRKAFTYAIKPETRIRPHNDQPPIHMSDLLTAEEIKSRMKKAPEWELEKNSIARSLEFDDFMEGTDFVNGVAEIAEEASHHPEIDVRYCTVTLRLTTHDQGGLTDPDFDLAQRIDNLLD